MSNPRSVFSHENQHPNLGPNSSSEIENLKENFAASLELKDNFPGSLELSRGTIDSSPEASEEEKEKAALCHICNGSHSTGDCTSGHMTDSCPDKKSKPVDDMIEDDDVPFSDEELIDAEDYFNIKCECGICGDDHVYCCCPYLYSVPQDAEIGSSFERVCGSCRSPVGKDLFCSSCDRHVIGCVIRKYCFHCEEYGEHTEVDCPNADKPPSVWPMFPQSEISHLSV